MPAEPATAPILPPEPDHAPPSDPSETPAHDEATADPAHSHEEHVDDASAHEVALAPRRLPTGGPIFNPALPELKSIRLIPAGDMLRVVFALSRSAPYVVRLDEKNQRAIIELIGVQVRYFQSELNTLKDPRVTGIWLDQAGVQGSTIELRLAGDTVDFSDFSMSDPPVVVLDFFEAGASANRLPAFAPKTVEFSPPPGSESSHETHADDPDTHTDSGVDVHPGVPAEPSLINPPSGGGSEHGGDAPPKAPPTEVQTRNLLLDPDQYDGFPIDEIITTHEESSAVFDLFLNRQWATAFTKGVKYIEDHPQAGDIPSVLYLLAESRIQFTHDENEVSLLDRINYYEQAMVYGDDESRLAAFANYRLAGLRIKTGHAGEAMLHLGLALKEATGMRRTRIRTDLAKAMARNNQVREALELARTLQSELGEQRNELLGRVESGMSPTPAMAEAVSEGWRTPYDEALIELAGFEASVRLDLAAAHLPGSRIGHFLSDTEQLDHDELTAAWDAFQRADQIKPMWWNDTVGHAELYARTANALGEMDLALDAYSFAVYSGTQRAWDNPGMYLAYADLLRRARERAFRQGDRKKAEEYEADALHWYTRIMGLVESSDKDAELGLGEAKRRLREAFADDITAGAASLALFHATRGETLEAMAQLRSAQQLSVLTATGIKPLREEINIILPLYMDWAVRQKMWDEAVAAWLAYGSELELTQAHNRSLTYLVQALIALELDDNALEIIDFLMTQDDGARVPQDLLFVWRAEILDRMGRGEEVIPRLEVLARSLSLTNLTLSARQALAAAYDHTGSLLKAAQEYEKLARAVVLDPEVRGNAWLRAAEIYLDATPSLTQQAIELTLTALIAEEDFDRQGSGRFWSEDLGDRLQILLARAYRANGDFTNSNTTLEFYVARESVSADERGMAYFILAENYRTVGQIADAEAAYDKASNNDQVSDIWRKAATEAAERLRFDRMQIEVGQAG